MNIRYPMGLGPEYGGFFMTIFRLVLVSTFFVFSGVAYSKDNAAKKPAKTEVVTLVEFASDEGVKRFSNSTAKVDFFTLANQFEGQSNGLFCGPTTAAIVLNALRPIGNASLPKDKSRFSADDLKYLPKEFDPSLARYTQDVVVEKGKKPRAEVFGKPVKSGDKEVDDFGYQLRQFNDLLLANGLKTEMHVVDDKFDSKKVISDMAANLKKRNDYVIVNYKRAEVGQKGGGHISPVAAYDQKSNSFLILDVNPSKATWVWMPADTLIKGMRSFDTVENRGYVLVHD